MFDPRAGLAPAPAISPDMGALSPLFRDDASVLGRRFRQNAAKRERDALIEGLGERQEAAKCRICGKVYPTKPFEDGFACYGCARRERETNHPINAALAKPAAAEAAAKPDTAAARTFRKPNIKL